MNTHVRNAKRESMEIGLIGRAAPPRVELDHSSNMVLESAMIW